MDLDIFTILLMPPFLIILCFHSFHHLHKSFYYPLAYIQHSLVVPLYCCQSSFKGQVKQSTKCILAEVEFPLLNPDNK